jgi:hypothetical protein
MVPNVLDEQMHGAVLGCIEVDVVFGSLAATQKAQIRCLLSREGGSFLALAQFWLRKAPHIM